MAFPRYSWVLLAGLLGAGALSLTALLPSHGEAEPSSEELAALREELEELKSRRPVNLVVGANDRNGAEQPEQPMGAEGWEAAPDPGRAADGESAAAEEPEPTGPGSEEEMELSLAAQFDRIDDALAEDSVDTSWAPQARASLLEAYGAIASGVAIDCRSALCRIDMRLGGQHEAADLLRQTGTPWPGMQFTALKADGSVTMFLAREGHQLPAMDAHDEAG